MADLNYVACVDCSKRCLEKHGSTIATRTNVPPSFVISVTKDMLHGLQSSPHMIFPHDFAHCYLSSKSIGEASLEGPSGWTWHAHFKRDKISMLLSGPGWENFVKDHQLEECDVLMFTFLGKSRFKVRIFDKQEGIEKGKSCFPSTTKLICSSVINAKDSPLIKNKEDQSTKDISVLKNKDVQTHNGNGNVHTSTMNQYDATNEVKIDDDMHVDLEKLAHMGVKERAQHIHSQFASKLPNPLVTKVLTSSSISSNKLIFPKSFVKRHMPNKNIPVVLIDSHEKKWKCRWLGNAYTRETLFICGGWAPFVRAKSLKVNDICIFELLDELDLQFRVHIFRS